MPTTEKIGHTNFTMVAPVVPERHIAIDEELRKLNYRGKASNIDELGFGDIEMLHYASMFLFEDSEDGWMFVFESNIDGTPEGYLDRLVEVATQKPNVGALFLSLYENCRGFTGEDLASLRHFLADHIHLAAASFVAGVGLSRDRTRTDAAIHRIVDKTVGTGVPQLSAKEATDAVLDALAKDSATASFPDISGDSGHAPSTFGYIFEGVKLFVNGVAWGGLSIWNLHKERAAAEDHRRPSPPLVRAQKEFEDHTPTNHMASIVHVHTDWSRQNAKKFAYRLLMALSRLQYHSGDLGGIDSIHFAHWAFLNDRRRLLFVSNFDGNWDSYLDDFTLKANHGLTLTWAHGIGFPRSLFMWKGGAAKGPEFIDWARRSMVPCPVWYNAYPGVSASNVIRNRNLRNALIDAKSGKDTKRWLQYV